MPTIYRFMPFSPERLELACSGKLWMSKPNNFNDPWDCGFAILDELSFGAKNFEASLLENYKLVFKTHLGRLFAPPTAPFKKLSVSISSRPWSRTVEKRLGELAVACFCSDFRNNLLWSYYAENHTGVCLKYEYEYPRGNEDDPYPEVLVLPVRYSTHIPEIEFSELMLSHVPIRRLCDLLFTKDSIWAHEREWRLINLGMTGNVACDLPKGLTLKHVYAGVRMTDQTFTRFSSIVSSAEDVTCSRLKRSQHTYTLADSTSEFPIGMYSPKWGYKI